VTERDRSEQPNELARRRGLLDQLRRQGIHDERVLDAMDRIPRARFVEPTLRDSAWENIALAIPKGQTISQPSVVALMTQALALDGTERVLEVGTGSGYQAAVLSLLAREVVSIERIPELAASAVARFEELEIRNVLSIVGDGSDGWEPGAPYDAIIVTAAARQLPRELLAQLDSVHGRMVIPLGPVDDEHLTLLRMTDGLLTRKDLGGVRFVPLIRDRHGENDA
jgi:protein-L-isoaspartate(D-aspartate) O-methyltransferase